MVTSGGPFDTVIVTDSPAVMIVPATGVCERTVFCGWLLLESCWTTRWMLRVPASVWTADSCMPLKFGSARPPDSWISTGLVCGQDAPAAGSVLTTVPTGRLEPTFWTA